MIVDSKKTPQKLICINYDATWPLLTPAIVIFVQIQFFRNFASAGLIRTHKYNIHIFIYH